MPQTISTAELRALLHGKADFLLLDVLAKEKFGKGHIEGARNVPLDSPDFLQAVARASGGDKHRKIVVYGPREPGDAASLAARQLIAAGHADVCTYEAGYSGWRHPVDEGTPAVASGRTAADGSGAAPARGAKGGAHP